MTPLTTIHIALLDEGVDVWRPVRAEHLHGTVYRIVEVREDDTEAWQFETGEAVDCAYIEAAEARILGAVRKVVQARE